MIDLANVVDEEESLFLEPLYVDLSRLISLSTAISRPQPPPSSRLSSPSGNLLNQCCILHSLTVPWLRVWFILRVASVALWFSLNLNENIIFICFLSIIETLDKINTKQKANITEMCALN